MQKIKKRIFEIIQIGNRDDAISKFFDYFIVITIFINIIVMFLDTFDELQAYFNLFHMLEVVTIGIFCVEYILRIWTAEYLYPSVSKGAAKLKFLYSFDGIVDLLTILPFFFLSGFVAFRILRVVRIFHLFRINAQYDSFNVITSVLYEKKNQIISSVLLIMILMFSSSLCMYSAEHEAQPEVFQNAFSGIWWAMSTVLTVGYGDIYPITIVGKVMAILIAFLGVGVVAIPTGIISAGFVAQYTKIKDLNPENRDYNFITISISYDHIWLDKKIEELVIPQGMIIAVIIRNSDTLVPRGDTVLQRDDKVIICAKALKEDTPIEFAEIKIDEDHPWKDICIKDLDISRKTIIVSIKRKNKILIPSGDMKIKYGDALILFTKHDNDTRIENF